MIKINNNFFEMTTSCNTELIDKRHIFIIFANWKHLDIS